MESMNETHAAPRAASEARHAPPASSALARAVHSVVQHRADAKILSIGPGAAVLELGKEATLVLFTWDDARADDLARQLKHAMSQRATGTLVVGLVGGTKLARRILKRARPFVTQVKVGQVHIDDAGALWTRDAGPVKKALYNLGRPFSDEEWARLLEEGTASMAEHAEKADEVQQFAATFRSRRPVVTLTLGAALLAVFGLEFLFGGTESPPVLIRMGALVPERVMDGEIWRLLACTFLHSGPMHVALNTYVLWVLGSFLERVLGSWRFLLLYGLSCLGASLVSLVFLEGFAVGASGGLWGLLGAHAVLGYRSGGLLPRAMMPGVRRAAVFNLVINLVNSFRPHVDMWAHFGGGAVGAALLLSGALTRGLPRLDEDQGHGDAALQSGAPLRVAGSVVAALLLAGLGLGLAMGQPWTLRRRVELVPTVLPSLGISLALPRGIELTSSAPPGQAPSVTAGDLLSDPGAAIVEVYPGDFTAEATLAAERTAIIEALKKKPQGARLAAGPDEVVIAGAPGVTVRYAFENGIEEEVAFLFLPYVAVKVDTLHWPALRGAVPRGYAVKVLENVQMLSGPPGPPPDPTGGSPTTR